MLQESEKIQRIRARAARKRRLAGERARSGNMTHPFRVLPIAVGAVIATLAVSAGATGILRDVSQDHYAVDIIKDAIADVR